ncbi:MerR family transcriptional regulator [Promicromonospora sp. NPDC059942]|uniref:MerR family transcriptional regulator n=1 Tax=Promicromonospora sp. NPDC059942 TaxID=3347009 RepID=UPI0036531819
MITYSPAQAAEVSGFSIDTLRYYEREGILRPIARTSGGHRTYTQDDLGWLDLVHCLRDTGMPIADVKRYAELSLDEATLAARVALLEEHDRRVQESIDALRTQQDRLREKISWYRTQGV